MPPFLAQPLTQTVQATPTAASAASVIDLSGPDWLGITGLLTIVLVILGLATLAAWWKDRQRKELSWEVVANTPLISVKEEAELKGRLEVLFDKQPAQNLDIRSVIVRLRNSGNVAIDEDDYQGHPIQLRYGQGAEVLAASVIETAPAAFDASAVPDGMNSLLQPVLLNKGDSVTVKALVRGMTAFSMSPHLRDVSVKAKPATEPVTRLEALYYLALFVFGTIIFGVGLNALGSVAFSILWLSALLALGSVVLLGVLRKRQ